MAGFGTIVIGPEGVAVLEVLEVEDDGVATRADDDRAVLVEE
jgi:hypothetical protein